MIKVFNNLKLTYLNSFKKISSFTDLLTRHKFLLSLINFMQSIWIHTNQWKSNKNILITHIDLNKLVTLENYGWNKRWFKYSDEDKEWKLHAKLIKINLELPII